MKKLKQALVSRLHARARAKFRVGIFMMQKDESSLLPIFVEFYGSRFGYENIHLFDNGSSAHMAPVLGNARKLGVNVCTEFNTQADFEAKGKILGDAMNKRRHLYDLTLPLDCDELVAVKTGANSYSCSRDDLVDHFRVQEPGIYMSAERLRNHPNDMAQFTRWRNRKLIFRDVQVNGLDVGFHSCTDNSEIRGSRLAYFELHNKPFDMLLRHARNKMAARLKLDGSDDLESYAGPGEHLVRYLMMENERDYLEYLEQQTWFTTNVIKDALAEQGVSNPFRDNNGEAT